MLYNIYVERETPTDKQNKGDKIMAELRTNVCIRFGRKSGKIDKVLDGIGIGMLELWGLQNTTKTKDTVIFDKETGNIVAYYEGTENFPKVCDDMKGQNIERLCPGLLAEIQKG